jgi:hypothetical protein
MCITAGFAWRAIRSYSEWFFADRRRRLALFGE